MKPHMAHIAETIARKQLVEDAKKPETSYRQYKQIANEALGAGFTKEEIAESLEVVIEMIKNHNSSGDALFLQGVHNWKVSCIASIKVIIAELKGQPTQGDQE